MAGPVATFLIGADGVLVGMNPKAQSLFSLQAGHIGRLFHELDVCFGPVPLGPSMHQAVSEQRPVALRDVEWERTDGDRLVLELLLTPLSAPGGGHGGVAVTATDVTCCRTLQQDLQSANRRLGSAYEELQSTLEQLETTNEELQVTVELLETTNQELQSTNEELESMSAGQHSANQQLQAINDELRDRTQELRETTEFMEAILSSLRSAVIVVDCDFGVRTWSTRAEDLWGLPKEDAVGRHLLSLDSGLPTDALKPMVLRLIAGEPGGELRLDAVDRRGRTIWIRVVGTTLRSEGRPAGAVLVIDELGEFGAPFSDGS